MNFLLFKCLCRLLGVILLSCFVCSCLAFNKVLVTGSDLVGVWGGFDKEHGRYYRLFLGPDGLGSIGIGVSSTNYQYNVSKWYFQNGELCMRIERRPGTQLPLIVKSYRCGKDTVVLNFFAGDVSDKIYMGREARLKKCMSFAVEVGRGHPESADKNRWRIENERVLQ